MEIFKGKSLLEVTERFNTDGKCTLLRNLEFNNSGF